ncbi:hypothetical protein MVEN_00851700 [Mycena venus]|uniref:DUF6534 domain-containing protein n=1 Tax=Mycena venus TaxID=2733690 RepID=A0A8H7D1H1_9AGAR|nr:hypothetical protein MVEN_00851700 [Mycena venus]
MAGVDLLFGPMLIGVVLNMMLYGAVVTQMFTYYQRYPNDFAWIRYFMLYLFIAQTANVVVEFGIIYDPLIIQYGKQAALAISPKLLPGDSVLISIVSAPIQLFTAYRISVITGSFILPGIVTLLSIGSFATGISVSINVFLNPEFRNFERFSTEVIVWLVLSAVCDIVIAIGMTHALYTRRTGLSDVDGKINRIIRLTLETGALTAITALADVMLFLVFPGTSANFIVDFPLSALYTCSVLAMLNSRERKKTPDPEHAHTAYTAPQMHTRNQSTLKAEVSFHGAKMIATHSQATFDSHAAYTEKQVSTYSSNDAASERTLTSHSRPDYYNYNVQEIDVSKPTVTRLQLGLPPAARDRPERF